MPSPTKSVKPILYSYWRSSCSWRVRAALLYKDVEHDIKPVHLIKNGGEQRTEEYKELNPAAVVPTLVVNGRTITESLAILEYLEEMHPKPSLLPSDPIDKAVVRGLCLHIASAIQPLQNLKVLQYVGNEKKNEWASHWIRVGFAALEKMLLKTAGKFSFGDELTMADLFLVPQVYNGQRFSVDISEYPILARVHANLESVDCIAQSHPSNQPDTPESEKITSPEVARGSRQKLGSLLLRSAQNLATTSTPLGKLGKEKKSSIHTPNFSPVVFGTPDTMNFGLRPPSRFCNSSEICASSFSSNSLLRNNSSLIRKNTEDEDENGNSRMFPDLVFNPASHDDSLLSVTSLKFSMLETDDSLVMDNTQVSSTLSLGQTSASDKERT